MTYSAKSSAHTRPFAMTLGLRLLEILLRTTVWKHSKRWHETVGDGDRSRFKPSPDLLRTPKALVAQMHMSYACTRLLCQALATRSKPLGCSQQNSNILACSPCWEECALWVACGALIWNTNVPWLFNSKSEFRISLTG